MSPLASWMTYYTTVFPRVSGDEPIAYCSSWLTDPFSPRERG